MGKYGIGKRVRDSEGDEGVIVEKLKGERRVEYDDVRHGKIWWSKKSLTPIGDEPALQVVVGKFYKASNGEKIGPMKSYCDGFIEVLSDGRMWLPDGTAITSKCVDLVSLVTPSIGDIVTLAEPATVTALNGPNASLKLASGKSYDLPTTALVQA